jgi:hypothetical protein
MLRRSRLLTLVLLFVAGAALSLAAMSAVVASAASGVDADAQAALNSMIKFFVLDGLLR